MAARCPAEGCAQLDVDRGLLEQEADHVRLPVPDSNHQRSEALPGGLQIQEGAAVEEQLRHVEAARLSRVVQG